MHRWGNGNALQVDIIARYRENTREIIGMHIQGDDWIGYTR